MRSGFRQLRTSQPAQDAAVLRTLHAGDQSHGPLRRRRSGNILENTSWDLQSSELDTPLGCRGPGQHWRAGQGQRQGRNPQGQLQPWPVCVGGRTPAARRPHKLSNRRATASSAECVRSANFRGAVNPRPAGPQTRRHVRAAALSLSLCARSSSSLRHSRSRRVVTNDKPLLSHTRINRPGPRRTQTRRRQPNSTGCLGRGDRA